MSMTLQQTRETLLAYAHVSLTQGDTTEFLSDTVVSRIMNTGEEAHGRIAVTKQIAALQACARDLKPKSALVGEGHAAVEIDFVTVNATTIPYS